MKVQEVNLRAIGKRITWWQAAEILGISLPRAVERRLERLRKSGLKRRSETDPDSRFLRARKGFTLGYTADVAVIEDHLIVEQRVTQNATDHRSLSHRVYAVEQRCRERPQKLSAESGFF